MYQEQKTNPGMLLKHYIGRNAKEKMEMLMREPILNALLVSVLDDAEKKEFKQLLEKNIADLDSRQSDLRLRLSLLTNDNANELQHDANHRKISEAIKSLRDKHHSMPSKTAIAAYTGLSRKTVHKYMRMYACNAAPNEFLEESSYLMPRLMNKVLDIAYTENNIRAASLYINTVNKIMDRTQLPVGNAQNILQLNGRTINHEMMQQLSPAQLKDLEEILNEVLEK